MQLGNDSIIEMHIERVDQKRFVLIIPMESSKIYKLSWGIKSYAIPPGIYNISLENGSQQRWLFLLLNIKIILPYYA
jgi:hypothetical protein